MTDSDRFELLRFCFRRTGNTADAQDVLSIVFLEAWRRRGDLRPETARAWLYGIATNVAHNHHRLARRHAAVALGIPVGTVRSRLARARERLGQLRTQPRGVLHDHS
jgi:DNA-directed RNA polymerase specialized sigma24 family protein